MASDSLTVNNFIMGILANKSGYRLVGKSSEITENKIGSISNTLIFWKKNLPEKSLPNAFGYAFHDGESILIRASNVTDSTGRPFYQCKYVLITPDNLRESGGKIYPFLSWISNESIPRFTHQNLDLPKINIPMPLISDRQKSDLDSTKEVLKVKNSSNHYLVPSLISILSQDKQLIIHTGTRDASSISVQRLVQTILVLLPLDVRSRISIAFGNVSLTVCKWANIIVKTDDELCELDNGYVRLDARSLSISGQYSNYANDPYYLFLSSICDSPNKIDALVDELGHFEPQPCSLNVLTHPSSIFPLIYLLPPEIRYIFASTFKSDINIQDIRDIGAKIDKGEPLVFLWIFIYQNYKLDEPTLDLLSSVWDRISVEHKLDLIGQITSLPVSLDKSTIINIGNLFSKSLYDKAVRDQLSHPLFRLFSVYIESLIPTWLDAFKVVSTLTQWETGFSLEQIFSLYDILLLGDIPSSFFSGLFVSTYLKIIPNVPLDIFRESNLHIKIQNNYPALLDPICTLLESKSNSLYSLISISNILQLDSAARSDFYNSFLELWSPTYENSRCLLQDLFLSTSRPADNQILSLLGHSRQKFEQIIPDSIHSLIDECSSERSDVGAILKLVELLFDSPYSRFIFLDSYYAFSSELVIALARYYLQSLCENDSDTNLSRLQESSFWKGIQASDYIELFSFISYLSGLGSIQYSDISLYDRLRTSLSISISSFLSLVDNLYIFPCNQPSFSVDELICALSFFLISDDGESRDSISSKSRNIYHATQETHPKLFSCYQKAAQLSLDYSDVEQFLNLYPQHSHVLALWLRMSNNIRLLSGPLLKYLISSSINCDKCFDYTLDLVKSIISQSHCTLEDWLDIYRFKWYFQIEIECCTSLDLQPSDRFNFLKIAKSIILHEDSFIAVQNVTNDCEVLGCENDSICELICSNLSISYGLEYLSNHLQTDSVISPNTNQFKLLSYFLRSIPEKCENGRCISILSKVLYQYICNSEFHSIIHQLYGETSAPILFSESLQAVFDQYVPTLNNRFASKKYDAEMHSFLKSFTMLYDSVLGGTPSVSKT